MSQLEFPSYLAINLKDLLDILDLKDILRILKL